MEADDFLKYWGIDVNNPMYNKYKRSDSEGLDDLWEEYINYVNELKSEGYKVLRNEKGKHKVIK